MASIKISNFGPITETGEIMLTTVLLVIGRQSSGKSTFMKVLCFCRWLDKTVMTSGEDIIPQYTHNLRFIKELKQFHRFNDEYFSDTTLFVYLGDSINIEYSGVNTNPKITRTDLSQDKYFNTKLSYIPSERNLISAIKNVDRTYKASERDILFNFMNELDESREKFTKEHAIKLSISDNMYYYNETGTDIITLPNGHHTTPFYTSSGVQSVMPVDIMTTYFTSLVGKTVGFSKHELMNYVMEILQKETDSDKIEINETLLNKIQKRLNYQSVQLFIEEPEQNLYPDSQRILITNLFKNLSLANQKSCQNMMVLTTHSPYVLSVLNVLLRESAAIQENQYNAHIIDKLDIEYYINPEQQSAYYINEEGCFVNIKDTEVPMFSGNELDSVSDWVDNKISKLNDLLYGTE